MEKEIELKVTEAQQDDVDKGIVRIDTQILKRLGAQQGTIIEINGERRTVAIAGRAFPADLGLSIIRMDGLTRRNAGTSIGEYVKVRSTEVREAKSVSIAPAQKGVMIQASPESFKRSILGRAVVKGDIISLGGTRRRRTAFTGSPFEDIFSMMGDELGLGFGFGGLKFVVVSTSPKEAVLITETTELEIKPEAVEVKEERVPEVTYEDIGGLDEETKKVREMIELPLKHPEVFERLGIQPPKGVLLHGPPGTGKTLLAKAVATESSANFISLNGPEVMSKFVGEAEERLRKIFEEGEKNAPSIIFIDELDAIAPKREESYGEVERRVVAQLLALMDGLKARGKVVVIGATNRPQALDPALRRGGRFDREIEIGVPNKEGRLEILKIHTRNMPLAKDVNRRELADVTHGFVGADLESLCKEAAMYALRRVLPRFSFKEEERIPKTLLEKLGVTKADFKEALKLVRPSAMREVLVESPKIKWEYIGGLELAKQQLREAVEWPLKNPEVFKRMGIKPPRGILLYGPPGCGKTLLAKAVATESEANFISIKGPEILSKWVGESLPYGEKLIVKKNGRIQRMKIGEIVENKEDVEILAFDKDKRVNFAKIGHYIKHPLTSQLLEITTRTGRKINVTSDHSLFSFVNGKFVSIPTNYLVPNESYIAIPKSLNLPKERIKNINLYDYFKKDESVFVSNVKDYLVRAKLILGLNTVSQILGISKKYLTDVIYKNLAVPIIKFDEVIRKAKLALNPEELQVKLKGSKHNYQAMFKIDKDFWRLIGLWVAEGDFNGYTVRIHNTNFEIRKDSENICKKYGFNISKGKSYFSINSLLMQKIFINVLGLVAGAKNKKIPELVFILDKESKANFLKGYFSGDGSIYEGERGKFQIEAGTISRNSADDLLYLLLDFGIVATIYKKKERTNNITYRLSILGVRDFEEFKEIGFIGNSRNNKIRKYIESRKWFRSELIPLSGELYNIASQNVTVSNAIGKERLKGILIYLDKDKSKYKEYWNLVEGDIFFDLVKEIKILNNEKYVYDISVPDGQNFIAGFGGVFAHNSEKAIREIFKKARQVSPAIIFFDEIDAIATVRSGGEGDARVANRVVNQILTEIDGLEELTDLVVLAATNRPDLVDPSLIRAGRLDRHILVLPPDEKARLAILKIHTKDMPLAKNVKIEDLARRMQGYSGADIEAICREAAMLALRKDIKAKEVRKEHFDKALSTTSAPLTKEETSKYTTALAAARAAASKIPEYMG